jgi:hypothetical protein
MAASLARVPAGCCAATDPEHTLLGLGLLAPPGRMGLRQPAVGAFPRLAQLRARAEPSSGVLPRGLTAPVASRSAEVASPRGTFADAEMRFRCRSAARTPRRRRSPHFVARNACGRRRFVLIAGGLIAGRARADACLLNCGPRPGSDSPSSMVRFVAGSRSRRWSSRSGRRRDSPGRLPARSAPGRRGRVREAAGLLVGPRRPARGPSARRRR